MDTTNTHDLPKHSKRLPCIILAEADLLLSRRNKSRNPGWNGMFHWIVCVLCLLSILIFKTRPIDTSLV